LQTSQKLVAQLVPIHRKDLSCSGYRSSGLLAGLNS